MDAKNQTKNQEDEMIKLNRMTDADIEAFAGVEDFANGSKPLSGEFDVNGQTMMVVAGGSGTQVFSDEMVSWAVADGQVVEFFAIVSLMMSQAEFDAMVSGGILIPIAG